MLLSNEKLTRLNSPFATFVAIHFEVGGDTRSLQYQETHWLTTLKLIELADRYKAKLTLQFNPQWAEYILNNQTYFNILKKWQEKGHEIGLHHHGYDHGDWDGYTNRKGKETDSRFRGRISNMMEIMRKLIHPYELLTGTITDEKFDYPYGIKYDTEGIRIYHGRTKPKRVILNDKEVIQVGMAFLSPEGNIESFKQEYLKSNEDEIFGAIIHEMEFAKYPEIIEEWFKFIKSRDERVETVSEIITEYQKVYDITYSHKPLTFFNDVVGTITSKVLGFLNFKIASALKM